MVFLIPAAQFNALSKPYPSILSGKHAVLDAVNADKDAVRGVRKITDEQYSKEDTELFFSPQHIW